MLSGGERSLTALAFLFAVFRSRPSPFYVMDEVEAALDDINLHRFLGLVAEFRKEAQLLIVSHQKRTMEAGDSLLGVTHAARRFVEGDHRTRERPRLTRLARVPNPYRTPWRADGCARARTERERFRDGELGRGYCLGSDHGGAGESRERDDSRG